jgi:signal transduction histidine kinase
MLDANRRDGDIRFSVRDQGPGISQSDQQLLFNPFWQAHKGKGGAGLGLAITKAIVQAHGGRIWVDSAPGAGSTFFFTLRLAPPAPNQSIAAD